MNGLFSFTPDGGPLLGESKEARGFWIAEAVWITHAIGVGKVMAEWITSGEPSMDISGADVHRFEPYALSPSYILTRRAVVPGGLRHHPPPAADGGTAPLAHKPLLPRQQALGAYFLEASGWERPQWFEANETLLDGPEVLTAESGLEGTGRRSSPPKPWPPASAWPSTT